MSITRRLAIRCDGSRREDSCGRTVEALDTERVAAVVRARLRRLGWTRDGIRDRCPEHSAAAADARHLG